MRNYVLLLLCLLFTFSHAQNWDLITADTEYNYSKDSVITATVWVDSVNLEDSDSVFYLNKTSVYCEQCEEGLDDYSKTITDYYLRNQPSLLQSKIVKDTGGFYHLVDTAHYLLKSHPKVGESWVLDSINGDTITCIEKKDTLLFDVVADSVLILQTSSMDTVVLSKHHGILVFPDFKGNHYRLVGIKNNQKLGLQHLQFEDFFNLKVGDVFQRKVIDDPGRWTPWEDIQKHTVLSIEKNEEEVVYETSVLSRKLRYDFYTLKDTVYSKYTKRHVFKRADYPFLDKYPNDNITNENPITITYNNTFECYEKSYSLDKLSFQGDTAIASRYPPHVSTLKSFYFLESLGLLAYYDSHDRDQFYSINNSDVLTGYFDGENTYGTIEDDSFFEDPNSIELPGKAKILIYPTLFREAISINHGNYNKEISVELIDMQGRVVFSGDYQNEEVIKLDTYNVVSGVYTIRLSIAGEDEFVSKVIKFW